MLPIERGFKNLPFQHKEGQYNEKRALSGFLFTVIALLPMVIAANGLAYDINDYFPLDQGFTWTYELLMFA